MEGVYDEVKDLHLNTRTHAATWDIGQCGIQVKCTSRTRTLSLRVMSNPRTVAAPKAATKEARRMMEAEWSPTMVFAETRRVAEQLLVFMSTSSPAFIILEQLLFHLSSHAGYVPKKAVLMEAHATQACILRILCDSRNLERKRHSIQNSTAAALGRTRQTAVENAGLFCCRLETRREGMVGPENASVYRYALSGNALQRRPCVDV